MAISFLLSSSVVAFKGVVFGGCEWRSVRRFWVYGSDDPDVEPHHRTPADDILRLPGGARGPVVSPGGCQPQGPGVAGTGRTSASYAVQSTQPNRKQQAGEFLAITLTRRTEKHPFLINKWGLI